MTANQIITQVMNGNQSLVFLSRSFIDRRPLGTYLKDKEGNLERVHGKSASAARDHLVSVPGVVRSYGVSTLNKTQGSKSSNKKVFMSEYLLLTNI